MNQAKIITLLFIAAGLAACNGLGKMAKKSSTVQYTVTPNPLELHGDSVGITINGTYPAKYFAKKVDATVTPLIKTASGEHQFKSVTNVGEKSTTAGTKINSKTGGSFTYTGKIAYAPDMRVGDVMVKAVGTKGTTTKEFGSVKIADATIVTPLLVKHDEKAIVGKDAFQRIVPVTYDGQIYYLINTANVNSGFKVKDCGISNKTEMAAIDSAVKNFSKAPYVMKGVAVSGYASPDGTEKLNTTLAQSRSENAVKYLSGALKKNKMKVSTDSSFFTQSSTAEDWAGFQQLMQSSDLAQKDMILRIVASNSDPEAREMEIKKMGQAYTEIAETVLPKLRRAKVAVNAEKIGRSDEEIARLASSNPDSLSVEELLYAATLASDNNQKLSIYQSAERIYPQDWRTSNNIGMTMLAMNNVDGAISQFNKADQLSANNPVVKNNLGACYSRKGDRKKAAEMYAAAAGAGAEVNENQGIVDILNGNYSAAVSHFGSTNSFNASLAKLLAGDKDGAMSTIEASPDKETASGYYLKAVISARKGDAAGVTGNLSNSIAKDSSMKKMASEDREFIKWFNESAFKAIVQ